MRRRFATLDVFTDTPLAGNPLAIVRDCGGLDDARMQAIAREFNLSETVFLLEPRNPVHSARVRIFTPTQETPFAGHPIVGAAAYVAHTLAPEMIARGELSVVLEAGVGIVSCSVRRSHTRALRASFDLPVLPCCVADAPSRVDLARALSLDESDIGFDAHMPSVFSAGLAMVFAPVRSRAALARARADGAGWDVVKACGAQAAYLYTRDVADDAVHVRARMFAPTLGIPEDPATGSAAAAFAGVCMAFEQPDDGEHTIIIEQGVEMGRPGRIALGLRVADGALQSASVGGGVTLVSEGTIDV